MGLVIMAGLANQAKKKSPCIAEGEEKATLSEIFLQGLGGLFSNP
jgi:hypothetical protein